jgi:hypothetical protein
MLPSWLKEWVLVNVMKNMRQEAADKLKMSTLNESQKKTL